MNSIVVALFLVAIYDIIQGFRYTERKQYEWGRVYFIVANVWAVGGLIVLGVNLHG